MSEAAASPKPKCFVIAPIGADGSDTRWKSDRVLKHIVRATLQDAYDVERADDIRRPGIITVQIIQQLLEARMVVADLSEANPNVYYELAVRHAARKPVIHMIAEGEDTPFDVSQMRFIRFNIKDLDSVERARQELGGHVRAIEAGEDVQTPIQVAQIIASLPAAHGSSREIVALAQMFSAGLENLQQELRPIKEFIRAEQSARFFGNTWWAANPPPQVDITALNEALARKEELEKRTQAAVKAVKAIQEAKRKKE